MDTDPTDLEATERLQAEFPAEDFANHEEDQAEVRRVTEGIAPEQLGVALDHVLQGLRGTGEVDCEALARDIGVTPERAFEMVARMVDAHSRLVTANLFGGDADLHADFVRFALQHHREAYVKASEAVARTQSSKPMAALVQRRIAALKSEQAAAVKAKTQGQTPQRRSTDSRQGDRHEQIGAVRRSLQERAAAHWEEQRRDREWLREID